MTPHVGPTYDGLGAEELRARLGVPRLELFESVGSTLDVAHRAAAEGAPAGTLVLAERQTAGRGRGGRPWASAAGAGIWLALLERRRDAYALEALPIRVGLYAARALDRFAPSAVRLKWPNDLLVGGRKLAGVLVETRWRRDRVDWVAVGVGINTRPPEGVVAAAALAPGAGRVEVLGALLPALRAAAAAPGSLTDEERDEFAARDAARGRAVRAPAAGVVLGIDPVGAVVIQTATGPEVWRTGSLVFDDPAGA